MKLIKKNSFIEGKIIRVKQTTDFSDYAPHEYPIHEFKNIVYEAEVEKYGSKTIADITITGSIVVEDSMDAHLFELPVDIDDEIELIDDPASDGEGFIVEGANVDFDDLVIRIIRSSLPIQIIDK